LSMFVGDGSGREGYMYAIADSIQENHWYDLTLIFKLYGDNPSIDIVFNGAPSRLTLTESDRVDNEKLNAFFSGGKYSEHHSSGLSDSPAGMAMAAFLYFYFAYDTLANVGELYYSNTPVSFDLIPDF